MKLSLHPSLVGGLPVSWPDLVATASQAGFDAVDVPLREASVDDADRLLDRMRGLGVTVGGVPLPVEFRGDEATFQRDLRDLPRLARFAAAVGATTLSRALPASSDVPRAELLGVLRRRLMACAEILADSGLRLAVEFLGPLHLRRSGRYAFLWRMDETLEFALSCGGNVGLLLDAWHWHHVGAGTAAVVDAGDRVFHVQVADATAVAAADVRDDQRAVPGTGVADLLGFFRALAEIGFDGVVSPEVFGYRSSAPTAADRARLVRAAVADLLARAVPVPGSPL